MFVFELTIQTIIHGQSSSLHMDCKIHLSKYLKKCYVQNLLSKQHKLLFNTSLKLATVYTLRNPGLHDRKWLDYTDHI